jgi:hypothetical protein
MKDDGDNEQYGDTQRGDGIYSGKATMNQTFASGFYQITFYIDDALNIRKIAAVKKFYFSGIDYPPELSGLSILNSVSSNTEFDFSIKAADLNGIQDIKRVYYRLFRPDGTQQQDSHGLSDFDMYDDGSSITYPDGKNSHDQAAGDGTFTSWLSFPSNVPKGSWKFEFEAVDRADNVSAMVTKIVELQ